jgi:hypothetical protein
MRPRLKISQRSHPSRKESIESIKEPISMVEDEILNQPIVEEMMISNSKEKDERSILDEPMVAKALELFAPTKVRVKRKS